MRRATTSALLMVCLTIFLCPAVGKSSVSIVPKQQIERGCCKQTKGCAHSNENNKDECPSPKAQDKSCCPVSCSTLILFCGIADRLSAPAVSEGDISVSDYSVFDRGDPPPVPPPRP